MKKKILYGIFLVSIFLLSTATMVQPVRGYSFGVPKEAVGVTTNSEVKIFDEDAVDDHLGAGVDLSGLHDGDSDVVGARSQTLYGEIERDEEIDYLDDYVAKPADIDASLDGVRALLQSMAFNLSTWAEGTYGPIAYIANYSTALVGDDGSTADEQRALAANAVAGPALLDFIDAIDSYADLAAKYSKDYDGVILNRETWDFHEDLADLEDDADNDDNPAPFFADPRDWSDVARNLRALEGEIQNEIDGIQQYWAASTGWYATLAGACLQAGGDPTNPATWDWDAYEAVNLSIADQLSRIPATNLVDYAIGDCLTTKIPLSSYLLGAAGVKNDPARLILEGLGLPQATVDAIIQGAIAGIGWSNYTQDFVVGLMGVGDLVLESIYAELSALIPDKAGFFLGQLIAGQPAQVPQGDFMAKVIEEYNLKEDVLYDMYGFEYGKDIRHDGGLLDCEVSNIPVGAVSRYTGTDLGGETIYPQAYLEFKWDGSAVIVEVEWDEDYIDPKDRTVFGGDNEDELKDFEIEFPYGDTGGQGTVSYMDGDEIFWQMGGVDQIPGFEITILLGASAIAILGLIYVIMKKRKM